MPEKPLNHSKSCKSLGWVKPGLKSKRLKVFCGCVMHQGREGSCV